MSTQHTPGPWSAAYFAGALRHIERNVDRDAYLAEEDARAIDEGRLNVPGVRYNPADLALIVAAPDLLAACEVMLDVLARAVDIGEKHKTPMPGRAALEEAACVISDAVAKARGGS